MIKLYDPVRGGKGNPLRDYKPAANYSAASV